MKALLFAALLPFACTDADASASLTRPTPPSKDKLAFARTTQEAIEQLFFSNDPVLARLQQQYQELSKVFLPGHYKMSQLQTAIQKRKATLSAQLPQ